LFLPTARYAFDRRTGVFQNKTWGGHSPGKGPTQPHGTFSTNHGCTYDSRLPGQNTIVVSDRANSRLEFFTYDPASPDHFDFVAGSTVDLQPALGKGTLPCNLRMYPEQGGIAITPDLAGPVGILDASNTVVSVVNVSVLLKDLDFVHPHDAMVLPNGDFVVATWAPGRIGYWKKLPSLEEEGLPAAVQKTTVAMAGAAAAATHYGDPLAGPCMSDEQNITITGVAGSVCSPAATGGKCPTDTPAGCTITPAAILQDQSGDKYCALECSPSLPIKDQKLADSICGVDNMSCKPISGVGICTYDA